MACGLLKERFRHAPAGAGKACGFGAVFFKTDQPARSAPLDLLPELVLCRNKSEKRAIRKCPSTQLTQQTTMNGRGREFPHLCHGLVREGDICFRVKPERLHLACCSTERQPKSDCVRYSTTGSKSKQQSHHLVGDRQRLTLALDVNNAARGARKLALLRYKLLVRRTTQVHPHGLA